MAKGDWLALSPQKLIMYIDARKFDKEECTSVVYEIDEDISNTFYLIHYNYNDAAPYFTRPCHVRAF